jgi:tRNA pseudouridine13 synthase
MSESAGPFVGYRVSDLPRAFGPPLGRGVLRASPADFQVDEIIGFQPEGEGEHCLVHLEKAGTNTQWAARRLAALAGVRVRDVSYSGLKDRHALTRQWFSVWLPGKPDPDWGALEGEGLRVLEAVHHRRKLRRGAARGNQFLLRIRDVDADRAALDGRLALLASRGIPNYFGEQRFGINGANLVAAQALIEGRQELDRHLRSLALSAMRSFLFNEVLTLRVRTGTWDRPLLGDLMRPDGSHGVFLAEAVDAVLLARAQALEVHPTGPLWGIPRILPQGEAWAIEQAVAEAQATWAEGLERMGMEADRRALRARVRALEWRWPEPDCLELRFTLGSGSYATMVVRELLDGVFRSGAVDTEHLQQLR